MTYISKFSKDEAKKIGIRINASRVLTGKSREDFAEAHGVSCMSIKNWELGRAIPRHEALLALLEEFQNNGVSVSRDWLLYGIGPGLNISPVESSEETFLEKQINLFRLEQITKGNSPVIAHVTDDFMKPHYYAGDIIGGVLISLEQVRDSLKVQKNTMWLMTKDDRIFTPCILHLMGNKLLYSTVENNELTECQSSVFAKIRWHYSASEQT